jgi:CRISPR-associated protein Csy1
MPPSLENRKIRLPKYNFFKNCLWLNRFAELFHGLRKLLLTDYNNIKIRDARDRLIASIVDRVIDHAWAVRQHNPGWSQNGAYSKLPSPHKIWLDGFYENEREISEAWLDKIVYEMSRWIVLSYNKILKNKGKTLGDDEFKHVLSLIKQHKEALR